MREGASRRGERGGVWDVGCGKVYVYGDGGQVGVWCAPPPPPSTSFPPQTPSAVGPVRAVAVAGGSARRKHHASHDRWCEYLHVGSGGVGGAGR